MKITKTISLLLCLACLFMLTSCKEEEPVYNPTPDASTTEIFVSTEEVQVSEIAEYEAKNAENSQVGLVVDSWLKVVSIGERDGRISVLVRNTADFDVQYAVLSVVCDDETLTFPMSTITAGSNAVLACDTNVKFNENAQYYSWEISDKIVFQNELSLYPEIFEIQGEDGAIAVKNISGKDIEGNIYVYFKTVTDGIFAEGTTYRICIEGLEKGEKILVMAEHFEKDTSKVMFVTYVQ